MGAETERVVESLGSVDRILIGNLEVLEKFSVGVVFVYGSPCQEGAVQAHRGRYIGQDTQNGSVYKPNIQVSSLSVFSLSYPWLFFCYTHPGP
jgi:hypothetical protein